MNITYQFLIIALMLLVTGKGALARQKEQTEGSVIITNKIQIIPFENQLRHPGPI